MRISIHKPFCMSIHMSMLMFMHIASPKEAPWHVESWFTCSWSLADANTKGAYGLLKWSADDAVSRFDRYRDSGRREAILSVAGELAIALLCRL